MHACSVSSVMSDSLLLWTVAHQAPLSMAFSRQEYWSGLPHPSPGDLPNPGIEPEPPMSPALQADSLPLSHGESPLDFIYDIWDIWFFSWKTIDNYPYFSHLKSKTLWILMAKDCLILTSFPVENTLKRKGFCISCWSYKPYIFVVLKIQSLEKSIYETVSLTILFFSRNPS